ncbi:tRNA (adenosine(37)-N6)-threonylcarbamoyltransferase complex dimerization subunit type 1 TsaB [Pararhizobium mangrovi]|uniref:tRNA (Adenosine(37)-N6)-threonylcarbamoyltransferase complex dimerization subunit type 1 TsaB n=1 Tax=Pararhizobium mangrovi TaxID=2590452 RepID=A0A506U5G6_9HYPH|nr:tRNA (adenosine(37)-N6)-threonylcarbamoyltransferase complex dimerization subunit type 1 TsaB [Pararhizobium mangrovi]TPW28334.1 tRNA (adenosine(37)-N6)-threonylcarbamoyltransferase complex dimerization subunit type 1 TsaB [Pararhizobium mangrovi]
MLTLALDTASGACQACVFDGTGGTLEGLRREEIGRGHAERLMPVIDAALAEAGVSLDSIGRVAVTIGPGSFTGIRVGVATARGLALALGCEGVGVSCLEAIAADHAKNAPLMAVLDARRGEVYCQLFGAGDTWASRPAARAPGNAARLALEANATLTGPAAGLVAEAGAEALALIPMPEGPSIATIARLAAAMTPPFERPAPLYLRGADAKPQTGFALARAGAAT